MKNYLKGKLLNTQKNETTQGFIFVEYVSLIVRMRLQKLMKDAGLLKKYIVEGLLLELEKLAKVKLEDGAVITTPMTKKQREILEALQVCA